MAAREQTCDSELDRLGLAYNDFTNLLRESLNVIGHAGMICGNNVFRKQDVGGMSFCLVTFADNVVPALNLASYLFLRIFASVSQGPPASLRAFGSLHSCSWSGSSLFCRDEFRPGQERGAHRDNTWWQA